MPEVTKICHGLTIGDLKFGNARPGVVEASLRPGETMEQALDELDERLTAWHKKRYPHLYEQQSTSGIPLPADYAEVKEVGIINLKDVRLQEEIEDRILAAGSVDELQEIKAKYVVLPAKLISTYNTRIKELSV